MSELSLHHNVRIRLGTQLILGITDHMVSPFLAIYFTQRVGIHVTGLMIIGVTVAGVLGGVIGGVMSDRWGRRRTMICAEGILSVTWMLVTLLNSPWGVFPYLTFLTFLVNKFFAGALGPTVDAMILDVSTSETRKRIYVLVYWFKNLSVALGVSTGGFLFLQHPFSLMACLTLVTAMSFIVTMVWIKETHVVNLDVMQNKTDKRPFPKSLEIFRSYRHVMRDKPFLMFSCSAILINALENQLPNYIGIHLSQFMAPKSVEGPGHFHVWVKGTAMVGLLQAENTVLIVTLMAIVSTLAKIVRDRWLLYVGIALYTIGYAVLGISLSPWVLVIAMFVATVGEMMNAPIRQVFLSYLVPDNSRSMYLSVYQLNSQIASSLGGVFLLLRGILTMWTVPILYLTMGILSISILSYTLSHLNQYRTYGVSNQTYRNHQ